MLIIMSAEYRTKPIIEIKENLKVLSKDIKSIKSDIEFIKTWINKQRIEEEKLKRGQNLEQTSGGWWWG